jgi:hypothetical protein
MALFGRRRPAEKQGFLSTVDGPWGGGRRAAGAERERRGGGMLGGLFAPPEPAGPGLSEIFVYAYTAIFGLYTLMFLFTPGKMVTDHFDAPATPMVKFWIRGAAFGFITMLYLINLVEIDEAVEVGTVSAFLCGVLYPWNAKLGYATDGKLPVKYPMHYVPEVLMAGLTGFGAYILATS